MVMLNLASDDPRKRAMQAPRITPIQAPRAVAPPQQEEGIASRFAQAAMNRGIDTCLLYTSPSPRDRTRSRMPSSA